MGLAPDPHLCLYFGRSYPTSFAPILTLLPFTPYWTVLCHKTWTIGLNAKKKKESFAVDWLVMSANRVDVVSERPLNA